MSASHGAAPSAVGYQHQTWWALLELLQAGADRPDAAITLELHDDVAWEESGTPTEALQVKHHQSVQRDLSDYSDDMWRTLRVWIDTAMPADAYGASLVLVTTQTAATDTAVAALRPESRDENLALTRLEEVARKATSKQTEAAREKFLELSTADRHSLISRILVVDGSPRIEDVHTLVRTRLQWALPLGHEELFLALVWQWWDEQALAMLQGRRRGVDVGMAQSAIAEIRDQFTCQSLPTLVELRDVDAERVAAHHEASPFVEQLKWVAFPQRNLQKAIVDYYRAYTQAARWVDEDLVGVSELTKFEDDLVDEWEREFDWMLDSLDEDSDESAKQRAGKNMLRQLLDRTGVTVRARYDNPFFARGTRHGLANEGRIGWHPDFESRIQQLLKVTA